MNDREFSTAYRNLPPFVDATLDRMVSDVTYRPMKSYAWEMYKFFCQRYESIRTKDGLMFSARDIELMADAYLIAQFVRVGFLDRVFEHSADQDTRRSIRYGIIAELVSLALDVILAGRGIPLTVFGSMAYGVRATERDATELEDVVVGDSLSMVPRDSNGNPAIVPLVVASGVEFSEGNRIAIDCISWAFRVDGPMFLFFGLQLLDNQISHEFVADAFQTARYTRLLQWLAMSMNRPDDLPCGQRNLFVAFGARAEFYREELEREKNG